MAHMTEDVKQSALYQQHTQLTHKNRIVPFAGYLMPLWYSSIRAEHGAVRNAAGLFDCTHMGVLEFQGPDALTFLNTITTNNVAKLVIGQAQYSYICDSSGAIFDDIIVYKRHQQQFMVVVNAANEPKIKSYLESLKAGDVTDDGVTIPAIPQVLDLRDAGCGNYCRVDIALQGPSSLSVLLELVKNQIALEELRVLKPFQFIETRIQNIDVILSRTGYTGAEMGFEIFVHPIKAPEMWNLILEAGKELGVQPCGLGSRDSLRIEAGLPLYGHELAGQYNISPIEAGYGWAVKLDKEAFVGQAALLKNSETYDMQVARIAFDGAKGVRPVRENDPILNEQCECIGWILSSANTGEQQVALAFISREHAHDGAGVGAYYVARNERHIEQGKLASVDKGVKVEKEIEGKILKRYERF